MPNDAAIDEIKALEERRYRAMIAGDAAVLDELCSDDLVGLGAPDPERARRNRVGEVPKSEAVLVDEISARPAAQRAVALKDTHKFKIEMDDESTDQAMSAGLWLYCVIATALPP